MIAMGHPWPCLRLNPARRNPWSPGLYREPERRQWAFRKQPRPQNRLAIWLSPVRVKRRDRKSVV